MMAEIDLLKFYPKAQRPIDSRATKKTEESVRIARRFDKDYFDGDRMHGYGGYSYSPRFWQKTVKYFKEYYNLAETASVLDVGCGKGFMLADFCELMPAARLAGIDVSAYAIENADERVKDILKQGDASELPFGDSSFDLVISINTIHNLDKQGCSKALMEINRVSKKDAFVTVDAWRTEDEKKRMLDWNLTALTYMHVDDWKQFFTDCSYTGDYSWFIP